MPFSATVFNVLIASPSDVPDAREAIAFSLYEWNALNAKETGQVLLPVMWESHCAPAMGDRPQGILNDQLVKSCDMLIGAFWTRLGSPTGVEESGTVEEVKWFLSQKKPVMLYYSDAPIPRTKLDTKQFEKLEAFKASIRDKGIQEQYASIDELKTKLFRQLTIVMRGMSTGPIIDKRVVREAQESTKNPAASASELTATSSTQKAVSKIYFEDYSEKAFIIRGETLPYKEQLTAAGGRWIPTKTGGKAWMFSKRHLEKIAEILAVDAKFST